MRRKKKQFSRLFFPEEKYSVHREKRVTVFIKKKGERICIVQDDTRDWKEVQQKG